MRLLPSPHWIRFAHQMIDHGRAICLARVAAVRRVLPGRALRLRRQRRKRRAKKRAPRSRTFATRRPPARRLISRLDHEPEVRPMWKIVLDLGARDRPGQRPVRRRGQGRRRDAVHPHEGSVAPRPVHSLARAREGRSTSRRRAARGVDLFVSNGIGILADVQLERRRGDPPPRRRRLHAGPRRQGPGEGAGAGRPRVRGRACSSLSRRKH